MEMRTDYKMIHQQHEETKGLKKVGSFQRFNSIDKEQQYDIQPNFFSDEIKNTEGTQDSEVTPTLFERQYKSQIETPGQQIHIKLNNTNQSDNYH